MALHLPGVEVVPAVAEEATTVVPASVTEEERPHEDPPRVAPLALEAGVAHRAEGNLRGMAMTATAVAPHREATRPRVEGAAMVAVAATEAAAPSTSISPEAMF